MQVFFGFLDFRQKLAPTLAACPHPTSRPNPTRLDDRMGGVLGVKAVDLEKVSTAAPQCLSQVRFQVTMPHLNSKTLRVSKYLGCEAGKQQKKREVVGANEEQARRLYNGDWVARRAGFVRPVVRRLQNKDFSIAGLCDPPKNKK